MDRATYNQGDLYMTEIHGFPTEFLCRTLLFQLFARFKAEREDPFNTHVTGELLKCSPTDNDKLTHSLAHGGFTDCARRFRASLSKRDEDRC